MNPRTIQRSSSLEELRLHGNAEFPFSFYRENFENFFMETADLHWHQEVEFQYVTQGSVFAQIDGQSYIISEGEGLFINSNTLHMTKALHPGKTTTYNCSVFLPELLAPPGGIVYQTNILPILSHPSLHILHLKKDLPWQKDILDHLIRLSDLERSFDSHSYISIVAILCEIWGILLKHIDYSSDMTNAISSNSLQKQRTAAMISYIRQHYGEALSVQNIADHAGISRSECFRYFHKYMQNKPIEYLNQYRISRAAGLLRTTNLSITEIFLLCGFNHQSYFGKLFRQTYQLSPAQYRKKYQFITSD